MTCVPDAVDPKTAPIPAIPTVDAYREIATQLILGPKWTYRELLDHDLHSWRESVDRVALALVEERRAGLLLEVG